MALSHLAAPSNPRNQFHQHPTSFPKDCGQSCIGWITWRCQWQGHCVHHQRRMPLQQILGGGESPSKEKSLSERLFENYLHETLHVIEIKAEPPHVTKC